MPRQGGNVDAQVLFDSSHVFLKAFPIPGNPFGKGLMRHLLDLVEHANELHSVFRFERGQRQGAVTGHNGGDAVLDGGLCGAIPKKLCIKMRMGVDKAWTDDFTGGINFRLGRLSESANGGNAIARDANIGRKQRIARAISNRAVSYD